MVSIINSWAQGIILAIIIATIIEIILPEGNNKKYVKTIIGIYIMFVMIGPLILRLSNKDIDINKIIENTTSRMDEFKTDDLAIETNIYIEQTYKDKLKEDMTQKIEEKGYSINSLNLDIETENEENYGYINKIILNIRKINKTETDTGKNIIGNTINKVENIEIEISENNSINKNDNNNKESISTEEIKNLVDFLNTEYGTDKEYIYINK